MQFLPAVAGGLKPSIPFRGNGVLDAFVERYTLTARGNLVLIALRLFLATLSLVVLVIQELSVPLRPEMVLSPLYLRPPALVAIIVCLLTALYYLLIARKSGQNSALSTKLAFLQVFVDIFLISVLIWHTGAVGSQFVVLYLISICSAAFVLKWNVAIMAAAASTILFCLVTLLYSFNVIPENFRNSFPTQVMRLRDLRMLDYVRLLLLPSCAFFLTGALAGALSKRLAMARLLHDEILEGIGEGVLVLDQNLKPLYHNRECKRLLGLNENSATLNLTELMGAKLEEEARSVLKDLAPRRLEVSHRRADGSTLPFLVRIIPMRDLDSSTPRGLIMAIDDITAEKKMEELIKHRQRIETMGQISATIAHEIRNPLASIRGAVQEIGRSMQLPENKKVLLEIVLSESDRLDQIITDFLRFARMRPPKLVSTDLGRVLADIKLQLSLRHDARDVRITLNGDEGDPFLADPEQLRQLFLNLGVNALQALDGCEHKEIKLHVDVVPLHRAGFAVEAQDRLDRPGVLVEVEDSGAGMPPDIAAQIFEPFYTTKATGTGLGLAIVQRVIQLHEGIVSVHSVLGEGTIFKIWIPTDLTVTAAISALRPAVMDGVMPRFGSPGDSKKIPALGPLRPA